MTNTDRRVELWPGSPWTVTADDREAIRAEASQHVAAVREAQRTLNALPTLEGLRLGRLADPMLSPQMYAKANTAMRHIHTCHDMQHIDHSVRGAWGYNEFRRYDAHDPALQIGVSVWFANKPNTLHEYRHVPTDRWHWLPLLNWPEGRCTVNVAAACAGITGGTVYVTLQRGQHILVWECCSACYEHLREHVEGGDILAEADAQLAAKRAPLPRWAQNA
ncbi:hypothetical protein [Mycobacterium neumannii]|uniref:hypothetical protein n=1 Tax=Mycobacterium neumannii TaxID=2048551 RepID=UPI003AB8ADEC